MISLEGKRALVTGASKGIGAAIARELHQAGATVVFSSRKAHTDLGERALAVSCDVSRPEQIEQLTATVKEQLGGVDILVNNAGVAASHPLKTLSLEEWQRIQAINTTAVFLLTKAFLPEMLAAGWGRVINIASTAGLTGGKYMAAYSASKHAVMGFTRCTAEEVAAKGVTVNAVCPGFVNTPMTDNSIDNIMQKTGRSKEDALGALTRLNPQGRLIEPDEIAFWALCLCSDRARGVNGQALVVDGGGLLA